MKPPKLEDKPWAAHLVAAHTEHNKYNVVFLYDAGKYSEEFVKSTHPDCAVYSQTQVYGYFLGEGFVVNAMLRFQPTNIEYGASIDLRDFRDGVTMHPANTYVNHHKTTGEPHGNCPAWLARTDWYLSQLPTTNLEIR